MPLTWDIKNCRDADSLMVDTFIDPNQFGEQFTEGSTNDQRNEHRITTHIGMMMHNLGINEITSDNIYDVTERYHILCTGDDVRVGVFVDFTGDGELKYYRMKLNTLHFADRIGMRSNVVDQTRDEWVAARRDGYTVEKFWEVADCWTD